MPKVIAIILGGGKGTRLFPLTKERSKPAVPFGGKHRIVDIPISNCINSGIKQIFLLTQFNSASLHVHISKSYIFDRFSHGFVEILAAEQTPDNTSWYEGTADAVRKNFVHYETHSPTHYLILSGDQLYRMDFQDFLAKHIESGAEISIATTAVNRRDASDFGIMKIDNNKRITEFMEKPGASKDIAEWKIPASLTVSGGKEYLASMGIYLFNANRMVEALDNMHTDFGKEIIPDQIKRCKVVSYIHDGYWEDIGTIRSFFEANINLTTITPDFNFYDEAKPIYTNQRNLPPSKINKADIFQSITSEGCVITQAAISNSVIGLRSVIESGCVLDQVVCMGADFYEQKSPDGVIMHPHGVPPVGIGSGSRIRRTIIDKNARIGKNCHIGFRNEPYESEEYLNGDIQVVDGVIVIKKGAVIPDGFVL
ncbi:MAG: glucose-1-phosphate adenylyltransferase [Treponemataceae bacterium]|nr:MAG: glucose-1-phosphate adenylyltransferase [Treponemataceae bacterium]